MLTTHMASVTIPLVVGTSWKMMDKYINKEPIIIT